MIFILLLATFLYSALSTWRETIWMVVSMWFIGFSVLIGDMVLGTMPILEIIKITLGLILPAMTAAVLGRVARITFVLFILWLSRK